MFARRAAHLAAARRNCAILDHIFGVAGGAGQDHWRFGPPGSVNVDKQQCSCLGKAGRARATSSPGEGERRLAGTIVEFDRVGLRYGTGAEVLRDLDSACARAASTSSPALRAPARRRCSSCSTSPSGRRADGSACSATSWPMRRANRCPPIRRRIGVVFQDFRLIRHLSAFDNVALPLRIAGHERTAGRRAGARDAGLGRARRPRQRAAADPVGRRAAARRHRPRGDRPARNHHRRRADRQRRCGDGGAHAASADGDEPARNDGDRRDP